MKTYTIILTSGPTITIEAWDLEVDAGLVIFREVGGGQAVAVLPATSVTSITSAPSPGS